MKRLKIALDCDDVLYECNQYAVDLLNRDKHRNYRLADIRSWGNSGTGIDDRFLYFDKQWFYESQPLMKGARKFVRELTRIADVYIVTSIKGQYAGVRFTRIHEDFPEIPEENIFIGSRKGMITVDILLDDSPVNIIESTASYPVVFDRPWNRHLKGSARVTEYGAFLRLVKSIQNGMSAPMEDPDIVCLFGPSASGKTTIANALESKYGYRKVITSTTRRKRDNETDNAYHFMDADAFMMSMKSGEFLESTVYNGNMYGTKVSDVEEAVAEAGFDGTKSVIVLDAPGMLALKERFGSKCLSVFIKRDKASIIKAILNRNTGTDEKVSRIVSLSAEDKNEQFADFVVENNGPVAQSVDTIIRLVNNLK